MLFANFDSCKFKISVTTIAGLGLICHCNNVQAQIISDRTTNTQVKVNDNISHIMGGTQLGDNLFHSFKQFSLDTNAVANFDISLDVENIFSRVTGGNVSQIDGLIQTPGNANLFLINPAGIIFGANAQLNVGGSFLATTAEQVVFEDGMEFRAVNPDSETLLTISAPIGLQYGGGKGEIAILPNANREENNPTVGLSIRPGNTLALLGGDVSLTRNSLNAIASNLEISSVKSGTIDLEQQDFGWNFNYSQVEEYGTISLSNGAFINSSGIVKFQGKTIDFSSGSGIRNFTDIASAGGITQLTAIKSVSFNTSFLFTQVGESSLDLEQEISSAGGDIVIKAADIFLKDGSVISAGTLSQGGGGNITLEASKTVELSSEITNQPSIITTSTIGIGDGGEIEVNTGKLNINHGSQVQALAGAGKGGTITVNARESVEISGQGILRSQDSTGNLIETILTSSITASSGIEGLPFALQPPGESGSLIINTPELSIHDSARISVSNYGLADAGDIEILTTKLNLDTAGEVVANTVSGGGGSISIVAQEIIALDHESSISTTAQQNGDGGNIFLETDNLLLLNSDTIRADAQQGSGGNISINTGGLFKNPNSSITASSLLDAQDGTVKIVTLDLNSRLYMGQKEYFPLVATDYIYTGCVGGKDFAKNHFQNIGRGGVPHNPIHKISNFDTLSDLGDDNLSLKSVKHNSDNLAEKPLANSQPISEANMWKINDRGNLELVAQNDDATLRHASICPL